MLRVRRRAPSVFRRAYNPSSLFFIALLAIHPHIGVRTNDPDIRRLTTLPYPYLVFYEVTETEIIIHTVRHAAREPSDMPGWS